jgi:zinc/manganese transport system substrate-binding protein
MGAAVFISAFLALGASTAPPGPIVCAESAYANIAAQLAGPDAKVTAILRNPAADPHMFEPTPSAARLVADARIVILNGIGYDPWMDRLIAASHAPGQIVINVAGLLNRHVGDNDHLWYDPAAMPALTKALCGAIASAELAQQLRCAAMQASLAALDQRIAALRRAFRGMDVAATEPVLGPLLSALGLVDHHAGFERAVMNGTEPRAGDVASFEDDLRAGHIRALIVNAQASSPQAERLRAIARAQGVPEVAVSETLPAGQTYQQWIGAELTALQAALAASPAPR